MPNLKEPTSELAWNWAEDNAKKNAKWFVKNWKTVENWAYLHSEELEQSGKILVAGIWAVIMAYRAYILFGAVLAVG